MTTPAAFLDRDGTMIEDVGYLDRVERLSIFPYSIDSVRLLNHAGYKVVIITNQAGVARGFFKEAFLAEVHRDIVSRFAAGGATIHGVYYCPHHPDATVAEYRVECDCRKPHPGLVRRAVQELALDLERSFVVGDKWLDIKLGHAVGVKPILVRTGYGRTEELNRPADIAPVHVVENLIEAVSWILNRAGREGGAGTA